VTRLHVVCTHAVSFSTKVKRKTETHEACYCHTASLSFLRHTGETVVRGFGSVRVFYMLPI